MKIQMKILFLFFLKVTLSNSRPVENKFVTTFALNVRNPNGPISQWGHPLVASGIGPDPVSGRSAVNNESSVPTVKIVENYSVTNVEKSQVKLNNI
jgi:hypothetical protein